MTRLVTGISVGFMMLLVSVFSAYGAEKIGVIDFQRIMMESNQGKKIQAEIRKKGEEMQQDLTKKGNELNKLQESFQKEQMVLSQEKLEEKERDLRIRVGDLKELKKKYELEMRKVTVKSTDQIREDLFKIAEEYGKKEGFLLIVEKTEAGVVFAKSNMDVTDTLIKLNNDFEAKKKN